MNYRSINAHKNSSINSLCLIKNTNFLLTGGGNDFLIKLHNLEENSSVKLPKEHNNSVNSLSISDSQNLFCSSSNDLIVLWDLVKQTKIHKFFAVSDENRSRDHIMDCKILNNNLVISCGSNYNLNFFDLRQTQMVKPIYSMKLGNDNLNSLDYSDLNIISVGSSNGNLYSIDLRNQNIITDYFDNGSIINIRSYSNLNLVNFENGTIELFDIKDSKSIIKFKISDYNLKYKLGSELLNDYYKEDVNYIVNGSEIGEINIWKLNNNFNELSNFKKLVPHFYNNAKESKIFNIVKFDSNVNRLISSSGNGFLHIWDNVI